MFRDAFKKIEGDEAAQLLAQVAPKLAVSAFDATKASVMTHPLSFYPGWNFLEIADHTQSPAKVACAIYKDNDVVPMTWNNEPIYALNARVPVQLSRDNIAEYVKFFFTYVRGKHGRFLIAENVDDIDWREDPPPAARKAIAKMLLPLTIKERGEDGSYKLAACMMFRDSLFQADITVGPAGAVELSNEELLVEDMPVMDDTLGQ